METLSVTRHNMTSLRVQKKAWSNYKGRHLIIIENIAILHERTGAVQRMCCSSKDMQEI